MQMTLTHQIIGPTYFFDFTSSVTITYGMPSDASIGGSSVPEGRQSLVASRSLNAANAIITRARCVDATDYRTDPYTDLS